MASLAPDVAREFWKALLDNSSRLIADAQLLLDAGSIRRARSLAVLAMEELGKALWIYDEFFTDWNEGGTEPHDFALTKDHVKKYMQAFVFGDDLAEFWGDYSQLDTMPTNEAEFGPWFAEQSEKTERAAKQANADKQRGFYADLGAADDAPSAEAVQGELTRSAQVIEMMLIKDHSRMKFDSKLPYDGTHEQQWRLMPTSHPEDFNEFTGAAREEESPEDDHDVVEVADERSVIQKAEEVEDGRV